MLRTASRLLKDLLALVRLGVTSRAHLAAENLFLRKQLTLYQERRTKPRRSDPATRITLVVLSRWLDWRALLTVVQPDTLIRWHHQRKASARIRAQLADMTARPRQLAISWMP